jgi:glycolate dehydrogenase iron-sulfur subunit
VSISPQVEAGCRSRLPDYLHTLDCVHCGLCLQACPTYRVSGREADSPRGRIYLLRGQAEGRFDLTPEAHRHLDLCVVCRNCETVCPSGIRMADMMESFRDVERRGASRWSPGGILGRIALRKILPHRQVLAAITDLLYYLERSGLRRALRAIAARVSPRLLAMEGLLPAGILPPSQRRIDAEAAAGGGFFPAEGKARMRVALFLGCIASEWYAGAHRATIRVLTRNGCDVVVPHAQTCCGALHRHAGYLDDAAELFEENRAAFGPLGVDAIVVNAAGCGAALKEPLGRQGPTDDSRAATGGGPGAPVRDICELLDEIGIVPPAGELRCKVAHHQACHLVHAQRIGPRATEDLLRRIRGVEVVPLPDADQCCGAGGIYNLLQPAMAREILLAKVSAILGTGAGIVVTANPGCWLQIRSGLAGRAIEVLHPVELLDRAYLPSDVPPAT